MWDEMRILTMEKQITELRRELRIMQAWHDTIHTPLWKRFWFVIQGYNFYSLGRWYKAPWNKSAEKYE